METENLFGTGGFVTSIVLSIVPLFEYNKEKMNHWTLISLMANFSLWSLFGFRFDDRFIAIQNVICLLISCFNYYRIYHYKLFNEKQIRDTLMSLLCLAVMTCMIYASIANLWLSDGGFQMILVLVSLSVFVSPFTNLKKILANKNAESLSLPFSVVVAFNTAMWMSYGLRKKNLFLFFYRIWLE